MCPHNKKAEPERYCAYCEVLRLDEAIQRVRELHTESVANNGFPNQCTLCGYEYPCVTIKALDGEQ